MFRATSSCSSASPRSRHALRFLWTCWRRRLAVAGLALVVTGLTLGAFAADTVEMLSGTKFTGKFLSHDGQEVKFEVHVGGRKFVRSYPVDRVLAYTVNGQRTVVNAPGTGGGTSTGSSGAGKTPAKPGELSAGSGTRASKAEIEALINQAGRTPPDWYDGTQLNFPQSLDLTWPQPPPDKNWNNQKNMGQYIWDIINPNPNKWREGVKLMHHVLSVSQDRGVQYRAMVELGRMYHHLLEDYARAAFWWQQAGVDEPDKLTYLAECYWRLGNRQMAEELLGRSPVTFPTIKLWADMGNLQKALQIAEAGARSAEDLAYIYAGDACRVAGQYDRALQYYQKLANLPAEGQYKGRIERNQKRARANIDAIQLFELSDPKRVPDGKYSSSSLGYEAQVQVEVVVQGGQIQTVRVTQHREKQFYSAISDTTRKIVEKQGVKGVDATSGATITSEAIINASAKALARKP